MQANRHFAFLLASEIPAVSLVESTAAFFQRCDEISTDVQWLCTRSGMLTPVPCTPAPATPMPQVGACEKSADQHAGLDVQAGGDKVDREEYSPGTPAEEVQVKCEITWPDGEFGNGVIDQALGQRQR